MLVVSWSALEHMHVRSVVVQLMAAAAELRHGSAHVGSWLTRLATSAEVLAGVPVAIVGDPVVVWHKAGATKMAVEARNLVSCMVTVLKIVSKQGGLCKWLRSTAAGGLSKVQMKEGVPETEGQKAKSERTESRRCVVSQDWRAGNEVARKGKDQNIVRPGSTV